MAKIHLPKIPGFYDVHFLKCVLVSCRLISFLLFFFFFSTMKRGEKSHFKVLKPWSSGCRFNFLALSKSSHNLRNFINTVHVGKNCYAYMQEKLLLEGQFSLKGFILF